MKSRLQSPLVPTLRARLLVGFLGERAQFGWWPTAFYEASSRLFLEPIFSQTAAVAQYHGVVEAARRLHDEHLSVGTFHLFRLPEEVEQDLHMLVQSGAEGLSAETLGRDKHSALDVLAHMVGSEKKTGVGPVAIGNVEDAPDRLTEIASVYHAAFISGAPAFPYLVR